MLTQWPPCAHQAAGDANDKESVRVTNAPALVVKVMCDFPWQDDLQEIALGVLVGLSQGDAKCKQAVKEAAKGLGTGPTTKLVERLSAAGTSQTRTCACIVHPHCRIQQLAKHPPLQSPRVGDTFQSSVQMMNNTI